MSGWAAAAQAGMELVDTGLQVWSAERANQANAALAKQTWTRQKEAMQSRYQWTMEDMRKAGLNPILAYQQGGGSAATPPTAQMQPVYAKDGISSAGRAYIERLTQSQNLKNMEAVEYRDREAAALNSAQHQVSLEQRDNLKVTNDILRSEATSAAAKATGDKIMMEMLDKYPQLRQIDAVMKAIGGAVDVGSSARSILPKRGGSSPITSTYKDVRNLGKGRVVTETIHNRGK